MAGNIVYNSKNLPETITSFFNGYDHLITSAVPAGFSCNVLVANIPNLGRSLVFSFLWLSNSNSATGARSSAAAQTYLDKWTHLPGLSVLANTVAERTPTEWLAMTSRAMAFGVHGANSSVLVPSTTSLDFLAVATRNLEKMPTDPQTSLLISQYRPDVSSTDANTSASCFAPRERHFMVLATGVSLDAAKADEVRQWAEDFYTDLRSTEGVALPGAYNAFQAPTDEKFRDYFAMENWPRVLELKRKWDPENVWRYAQPQLRDV